MIQYPSLFLHSFSHLMINFPYTLQEVPPGAITIGRILICLPRKKGQKLEEDSFSSGNVRFHIALPNGGNDGYKVVEDTHKTTPVTFVNQECVPMVVMDGADLKLAREGGVWAAVEWKKEGIFDFDYLVAM